VPQAIEAAIEAAALYISAFAADAAAAAGLSIETTAIISEATFYGVEAAAYIGLSVLGAGSIPDPGTGAVTLRQPNPSRRHAYGQVRLAGSGYLLWTAKGNFAGQVLPLVEGPIDSFGQLYLFDKKVSLDSDNSVIPPGDGTYSANYVHIFTRKGEFAEAVYDELISGIPGTNFPGFPDEWTTDCRGDGVASLAMVCAHGADANFAGRYPGGEPQPSVVIKAALVYDPRDGSQSPSDQSTWKWSNNPVLCLLDLEMVHERRAYTDGFDSDSKAILIWNPAGWNRYFASTIGMWATAADICDEPVQVANATAFLIQDADKGANNVFLASVQGIASGTSVTIGNDVVTVSSVSGQEITFSPVTTIKHVAGETAAWAASGGEPITAPRYTCGGFWNDNNAIDGVRQAILATFDGWSSQRGDGALTVYAGKLYTPTVFLTDDDILGYECQRFVEDESAVNEIVASYTEPGTDYNTVECLPWRDEQDILDTGKERTEDLQLTWVQSNSQARRLAKRRLAVVNAPAQGSLTCFMTDNALAALGERYVQVQCSDSPTLTDLFAQLTGGEIDLLGMTITYKWVAADPTIDEWNYSVEEGPLPFSANRASSVGTPTPTGLTATAQFEQISTGGQGVRIRLDFEDPGRDDLSYMVRWKNSTDASYNYETYTTANDLGGTFEIITGFVPIDSTIDISLQFTSGGGRPGDYPTDIAVSTSSASVAPGVPTGLAAANGAGHSVVSWTNPPSANLSYLQVYRGTSTSFGSAAAVSGHLAPTGLAAPQTWDDTGLAPGTYYFWVLAYNAAGISSAPVGPDSTVVT
jgi:hypothetical protein